MCSSGSHKEYRSDDGNHRYIRTQSLAVDSLRTLMFHILSVLECLLKEVIGNY